MNRPETADQIVQRAGVLLGRLRTARPRVQCLTNTVAQEITANVLLAVGARVSMATHADEVVDMTASADALLINLGTLDAARIAAIPRLLADAHALAKPRVLDPVFAEHASLRLDLARRVIAAGPLIVKGNAAELAALSLPSHATRVETGAVDRIAGSGRLLEIESGTPLMAQVTGLGCAAGALIAAFAAIEPDLLVASAAALLVFGTAGARAAEQSAGPGTFAAAFLDAIAATEARHLEQAVVRYGPATT